MLLILYLFWFSALHYDSRFRRLTNKSSPFQRTAARLPTVPTDVPHLPVLITVKCDEDDGDMVTPPMTPKETPRKQRRKPGDLVYDRPDSANRDIEPLGRGVCAFCIGQLFPSDIACITCIHVLLSLIR